MQGFPTFEETLVIPGTRNIQLVAPRAQLIEQSGNSMPTILIGIPILWALGTTGAFERTTHLRRALRAALSGETESETCDELEGGIQVKRFRSS